MTLTKFVKGLAKAHKETGFLHADTIDQDTLFKLQDTILQLILQAYESHKVSEKTLFSFDNCFTKNS